MVPRPPLNRPRRLLAGTVLCALLLTQALGLMHRVWHAHGPVPATASQAHAAPHGATAHRHAHEHPFERLFAHHHDQQDCKVFDQLTQADAPGPALGAAGAEPMSATVLAPHAVPARTTQAAAYLARGPPGPA